MEGITYSTGAVSHWLPSFQVNIDNTVKDCTVKMPTECTEGEVHQDFPQQILFVCELMKVSSWLSQLVLFTPLILCLSVMPLHPMSLLRWREKTKFADIPADEELGACVDLCLEVCWSGNQSPKVSWVLLSCSRVSHCSIYPSSQQFRVGTPGHLIEALRIFPTWLQAKGIPSPHLCINWKLKIVGMTVSVFRWAGTLWVVLVELYI